MRTHQGLFFPISLLLFLCDFHKPAPTSSTLLAAASPIGICYGRVANNLPPPSSVVGLLKSNNISRVRIFDTDPDVLRSFSGSGIQLTVGVPNEILPSLANGDLQFSLRWLQSNILSYIPGIQVPYIAVGNEVFIKDPYHAPFVVPAMYNLHQALQALNLSETVKLSTTHASCVLGSSFPPSAGDFSPDIKPDMVPLLQFLKDTDSPFMVNVYPFYSYTDDEGDVPLDYALFRTPGIYIVSDHGLMYDNLLDATLDSFVSALEKAGFGELKMAVTETGWPSAGGPAASLANALAYNSNVVRWALSDVGTPRKPGSPIDVFLFGLFDEDEKDGEEFERHFGVFGLDGIKAYDVMFN
ncbi:hypothetical protein Dimus_031490 [Dionaea muscipula]